MITDITVLRASKLKVGDTFRKCNSDYRVYEIADGRIYYKLLVGGSKNHLNWIGINSKEFVELLTT